MRKVTNVRDQLTYVAVAALIVLAIVGAAYGLGYLVGKLLL
jgi:F0F1-type ATP synthase membrane subunit c/vacuolar-type H+-ATPase subunit K